VRLRRLGNHFVDQQVPQSILLERHADEKLEAWLPDTSTNNYRIALRKYLRFQRHLPRDNEQNFADCETSDIY
jgi:hypothetical protein